MITWIIRILLWAAMLYRGCMKLWNMSPESIEFVGWAWHKMGLTFLSTTVWFWIAVIGQIAAGLMLLFWWKAKWGAVLTLVFMIFVWNVWGWDLLANPKAWITCIAGLIILFKGSWAWAICPEAGCCKPKSCSPDGKSWGCCGWSCGTGEDVEIVEVE